MAASAVGISPSFSSSFASSGPFDRKRGPISVMPLSTRVISLGKPLLAVKYSFTATRLTTVASQLDTPLLSKVLTASLLHGAGDAIGQPVINA